MNALSPSDPSYPVPPPMLTGGPITYVVQPAPLQRRWRDRPLVWSTVLAAVLFAMCFSLAPWFAYRALRSAARYDDPAALAQLVDYDAVRASLRPQLVDPRGAPAAPPPPNPLINPMAALQNAWAHRSWLPAAAQAPSPDAYLSPNALRQLLAGKAETKQPPGATPATLSTPMPAMVFFGLRRVRLRVRDTANPHRETILVLSRDKGLFEWRLAGVTLPQEDFNSSKPLPR